MLCVPAPSEQSLKQMFSVSQYHCYYLFTFTGAFTLLGWRLRASDKAAFPTTLAVLKGKVWCIHVQSHSVHQCRATPTQYIMEFSIIVILMHG